MRLLICAVTLIGIVTPAAAQSPVEMHVEGGFGFSVIRPLVSQGALSATASAGVSAQVSRRLRLGTEVTATVGGQAGMRIPEASSPGDRSLTTFLLGVEPACRGQPRGAFGFVGLGVGHATLSNARGVFESPYGEEWLIPSRSLTAFAIGAAAGSRFGGAPGSLGFQVGFRVHALIHSGGIPASAYALTLGVAY